MYRQLDVELARLGWDYKELAKKTGMKYTTLTTKKNGKSSFTFDECVAIKHALHSNLPLEELFLRQ